MVGRWELVEQGVVVGTRTERGEGAEPRGPEAGKGKERDSPSKFYKEGRLARTLVLDF